MDGSTPTPTPGSDWGNLGIDFYLVDAFGGSYHLRPPHCYAFGRDDDVNFQISDVLVSRRHSELRWDGEAQWHAADLGSRNGTWVNGERLAVARRLRDMDVLQVGGQRFTFFSLPRGADVGAFVARIQAESGATIEHAPGSAAPGGASFRGTFGAGGLLPILEFLLMTTRSGLLEIDGGGKVWVSLGAPVEAEADGKTGMEALRALAAEPGGEGFNFVDGAGSNGRTSIVGEARALLMSLARAGGSTGVDADDLQRAQSLQARLLERLPSLAGYEVGVRYEAQAGVGGDFYDIGPMAGGEALVVLGDVSGHGVQAALVVAMAVKSLRILRPSCSDPVELLARLNDEVRGDLLPGQFVTCFVAAVRPETGRVRVVLAGHHRGWVVGASGVREVGRPGMAIGLAGSELMRRTLHIEEFTLCHGEMLVQCTDGLLEAANAQGEEYGDQRLVGLLTGRVGEAGQAQAALDVVAADLRNFAGSHLADDLTLLSLARL